MNCLDYCALVQSDRNTEDAMLFPRLVATDPELRRVVDRLEAGQRKVSDLPMRSKPLPVTYGRSPEGCRG